MRAVITVVLAIGAIAAFTYWWQLGRPVELTDAAGEQVQCVSYAPYRRSGHTPLDEKTVVSPSQIEADLAILSRRSDCVRIYSVAQGLSEVPRIARKFNMKVLLGLWIGADPKRNEQEIALGLEVIARNPDAIKAVIVGNEVLLRREQSVPALRGYIERVRRETTLPVSYADVWEFWLRNPQVAESTSFVTVHILPYWEDDPTPIDLAVDHVVGVDERVQKAFPGQPILIGETGWPSAGRNRDGAQPSRVNQARFVREFLDASHAHHFDYNLIEAFDQPWKRRLEGTVGGYWGLFNADGQQKFPFAGPVAEKPGWLYAVAAGGAGAVLLVLCGWLSGPRPDGLTVIALALGGFAAGAVLAAQWEAIQHSSRDSLEWGVTGFYSLCALWLALRLGQALNRWYEIGAVARPAPMAALVRWFATNEDTYRPLERSLGLLRTIFLFGAATVCVLHVFDPRYRDFPLALYAIPALGYALLSWIAVGPPYTLTRDHRPHAAVEERWLAYWLLPAAAWIAVYEGPHNMHALWWSMLCVLLSFAVLAPGMVASRRSLTSQRQHA
jgi:glucan 1,3-beta-glucosidase